MPNGDRVEYKKGPWFIEDNAPYGFIVRNENGLDEYHFSAESEGWISMRRTGPHPRPAIALNSMGTVMPQAVLVDRTTTENHDRIRELRDKPSLTEDEKNELLERTGLRRTSAAA